MRIEQSETTELLDGLIELNCRHLQTTFETGPGQRNRARAKRKHELEEAASKGVDLHVGSVLEH
ncbi:MAG TPA: hypothetical protein VER04_04935 [Polyangiaceae bacterium]|nr:hypothetical protein [Polyangiaceae bacterium]